MKKWIRSLTSLMMSVIMILCLGEQALADDQEEVLPEPAAAETVESKPAPAADAPKPAAEAPKATEPKPSETKSAEAKPTESKAAEAKPAEAKPAEMKPAEANSSETKPAESKPAEANPSETKPAEAKSAVAKSAETKTAEEKPAETKPADGKPAESKPAETKPAEAKPADEKPEESKPAEEKPAESKPAETRPAEDKPAETAPGAKGPEKSEPAPVKEEPMPVESSPASEIPESPDPVPAAGAPEQAEPAPAAKAAGPEGSAPSAESGAVEAAAGTEEPAADDPPKPADPEAADAVPEADDASEPDRYTKAPAAVRAAPADEADPVSGKEVPGSEDPAVGSDAGEPSSADTAEEEAPPAEVTDPQADAAGEENADTFDEDHDAEESAEEDVPPVIVSAPGTAVSASTPAAAEAISDPTGASAASSAGSSSQGSTSCSYTIKDGSHVIVNHTGGSFTAGTGEEVTILAAGLNHVDSISGAGTVKIGGSGILLVDDFDSAALANMQLMSCTDMYGDKGGSVAVFAYDSSKKAYVLVNGSVPGILDEEYLLENVSLIVPEGCSLVIGSIGSVKNSDGSYTYYTGDNSGAKNWDNDESAGHLTLGSGTTMVVNGTVTLADTDSRVVDGSILPTLSVEGNGFLDVDGGTIDGGVLDINSWADTMGISTSASASLTNTFIKVSEHGASGVLDETDTSGSLSGRVVEVSTDYIVTSSGGVTRLDYDKIISLIGSTDTEKIVVELRHKYASGRVITERFRLTSDNVRDAIVQDKDSNAEVDIIKTNQPVPPLGICPYMGLNITNTSISATLTGILGGNDPSDIDPDSPSTVTVGGTTYVLRATETSPQRTPSRTAPAPVNTWRVIVSETGEYYRVTVYYGAREIIDPGQKMTARMKFTLPDGWDADAIFAVFRSANGKLTAFKAVYDDESGILRFDTDLTGTFALISFPFEGRLYSQAFYDALAELDVIEDLPVRR